MRRINELFSALFANALVIKRIERMIKYYKFLSQVKSNNSRFYFFKGKIPYFFIFLFFVLFTSKSFANNSNYDEIIGKVCENYTGKDISNHKPIDENIMSEPNVSNYRAGTSLYGTACPGYSNTVSSSTNHCGGQTYYLEVKNNSCNGSIYFDVVGNYGSSSASEITWRVESLLTSQVVASGGPGANGADIFSMVGPINSAIQGNIFYLYINDSYGDGFNGTGGYIAIQQYGDNVATPITGNFGSESHVMFMVNNMVAPAKITVTTPSGPVTQTVLGCNDFNVPFTINSSYFCNTTTINLPWVIRCEQDNSLLASGNHSMTIYPNTPDDISDIVNISFDEDNCEWVSDWQNDCNSTHLGDVFDITPNPTNAADPCIAKNPQTFTLQYNGINGGLPCCNTAGPSVPYQYTVSRNYSNVIVASSPFGG
ncbi:MAG: hypothetical protein RBR32_13175, partial [Bacteroidales bacterium]|nr:hypothetical protein [Bacteroidales bacterium]